MSALRADKRMAKYNYLDRIIILPIYISILQG